MIDLRELNETIDELKRSGSTIGAAEKLALLYIARDHMEQETRSAFDPVERGYSQAAAPEPSVADVEPKSAFLAACNGVPVEDLLKVLDEHMSAIFVLYPKEHEMIIRKLEEKRI